jgi:hypothetical protein
VDRTEPCGTPACISLGVDISPYTETMNSRCERKELMSLINLVENSNNLQQATVPCGIEGLFDVQEQRGRRSIIVDLKGHVV